MRYILFIVFIFILNSAFCYNDNGLLCLKTGKTILYINSADGMPKDLKGHFWSFKFKSGKTLNSEYFVQNGLVSHERISDSSFRFKYSDKFNKVVLNISLSRQGLDCSLNFENLEEDVCEVAMPASADFNTVNLNYVIFPNEMGVKFLQSFYNKQVKSRTWKGSQVGIEPFNNISGQYCIVEPNVNKETRVHLTREMYSILGESLSKKWYGRECLVVRPSKTKPNYDFITSESGSFWGGHSVGDGILMRFGGKLRASESDLVIETVIKTIKALKENKIDGYKPGIRHKIGLLNIYGCPQSTGWSEVPVDKWFSELTNLSNFVNITSVDDVLSFVKDSSSLVLINPYGEMLPVGDKSIFEISDHIKKYLNAGGVWIETGGYPFFNILEPSYYNDLSTQYPFAFSDIFEINTKESDMCFYGIQDEKDFVSMQWRTWADKDGGHISRNWKKYIFKVKGGSTPVIRFVMNCDFRKCIANYTTANNFSKGLNAKIPLATLEKWKQSAIMKFSGRTINEQENQIKNLPYPSIVHIWDYVKGGFDKLYPEHLPPNPLKGTMEDFKNIIKSTHREGNLFMPYTNNSWWCDDPRSETFKRVGKDALLKDEMGNPVKEDYIGNYGWNITPWHPEVVASGIKIAKEFSDLGSDILFEDQVGAREWVGFDFNPFSPSPSSYHQGLINLAQYTSAYLPLSTEQGYDRLINEMSEFCGLTWMLVPFNKRPGWVSWWLKSYSDLYSQDTYEAYPLAQYVANGNTFFTHHLGGPLVENSENLAWTLVLGYQIIIDMPTSNAISKERWKWVNFLSSVQKHLASKYMGQPMKNFEYLQGIGNLGVIRSVFDEIEIVANFSKENFKYKNCIVAPKGFIAITKEWSAGYVKSYMDKNYFSPCYIMHDKKSKVLTCYDL